MAAPDRPDLWCRDPAAQQLLAAILAAPHADHSAAVQAIFGRTVLDAHVASVVSYVIEPKEPAVFSDAVFTRDGGVALHTILYHLLGGEASGFRRPFAESTRRRVAWQGS